MHFETGLSIEVLLALSTPALFHKSFMSILGNSLGSPLFTNGAGRQDDGEAKGTTATLLIKW